MSSESWLLRAGTLLAGVLLGTFAVRRNRAPVAASRRPEIAELEAKILSKWSASDASLAALQARVDGLNPEAQAKAVHLALHTHEHRLSELEQAKPWIGAIQELEARLDGQANAALPTWDAYERRLTDLERLKPWDDAIQELEARLSLRVESQELATRAHVTGHRERLEQQMKESAAELQRRVDGLNREGQGSAAQQALVAHERRLAELEKASPWVGVVQELEARLTLRLESQGSATTQLQHQTKDTISSLARLGDAAEAFNAHVGRIDMLELKFEEHQRRLNIAATIAAKLEKSVTFGMLQLEEQLKTQAQGLDALRSATTHTAGELKLLTESVESLSRSAAAGSQILPLTVTQSGPLSSATADDAALARMFDVRL